MGELTGHNFPRQMRAPQKHRKAWVDNRGGRKGAPYDDGEARLVSAQAPLQVPVFKHLPHVLQGRRHVQMVMAENLLLNRQHTLVDLKRPVVLLALVVNIGNRSPGRSRPEVLLT